MENSAFGEVESSFVGATMQQLNNSGATSDTYKILINGKWHFLKRPKKEYSSHPHYIKAFEKEFEVGYGLNHQNIVKFIKKGIDEQGLFILEEYIDGFTLKDFLEEQPEYFKNKRNLKKFSSQILSALEYLHERQIIHLDLKPENILITKIGHDVKIIDLGFAYSDSYQFSTVGRSEQYAAPEQVSNNSNIDQRADIYSFGMLMLFAYTRTSNKNLTKKLPYPYRNCIEKCLETDKTKRFNNIQSIAEYLHKKRQKKRIGIWGLILGSVLILIGVMQLFIYKNTVIDISQMDAPNDILHKITTNTSLEYIKEHYGEPKEVYPPTEYDKSTNYFWYFKNLTVIVTETTEGELYKYTPPTASEKTKKIISQISFDLTDEADLLYCEDLDHLSPNFGKMTIGDYLDIYEYDGGFVSWGGKFCINIAYNRVDMNAVTIIVGPDAITNFATYILYANEWFVDKLNMSIQKKLHESSGDLSILNKHEKRQVFEAVKKLKINRVRLGYGIDLEDFIPFYID